MANKQGFQRCVDVGGKQPPYSTSSKLYVRLEPTDLNVCILVTALEMPVRGSTKRLPCSLASRRAGHRASLFSRCVASLWLVSMTRQELGCIDTCVRYDTDIEECVLCMRVAIQRPCKVASPSAGKTNAGRGNRVYKFPQLIHGQSSSRSAQSQTLFYG